MRDLIRPLLLACTAFLALAASAQTYTVLVAGHFMPCNPAIAGSTVVIQTLGATQPQQTLTAVVNDNCYYVANVEVTSLTGGFLVLGSCGNGMMTADSAFYTLTPPLSANVIINLGCGNTPPACQAAFTAQQAMSGNTPIPWQMTTSNLSAGIAPITYEWWMPDGSASTEAEPTFTFNQAGVYGICLSISADGGNCTTTTCDTVVVDSSGFISNSPVWYDCTGTLWGNNMPGSPCDDGNPATTGDTWTAGCFCEGQGSATTDCLGVPGGNAMPGTFCTVPGTNLPGTWSANCVCVPDTIGVNCQACFTVGGGAPFTGLFYNCSTGGGAPFTYTWDLGDGTTMAGSQVSHVFPGPGTYTVCLNVTDANGTGCFTCQQVEVDASGAINPPPPTPCDAGFWAIQAYDSTASGGVQPIPNEVWVWNLSSGGNGNYQFLWDFGDGSSSTDAYPTHNYDGPGPWLLCLTMYSGNCTDSYCDSISVDANGILNGMIIDGGHAHADGHLASGERSGGFTLNVIQQVTTGIAALPAFSDLRAWPNPVGDVLNLSFHNSLSGTVPVTVIDPSGRVVIRENRNIAIGNNTLTVPTGHLEQGLYMVRIGDGPQRITQRFLKVR